MLDDAIPPALAGFAALFMSFGSFGPIQRVKAAGASITASGHGPHGGPEDDILRLQDFFRSLAEKLGEIGIVPLREFEE